MKAAAQQSGRRQGLAGLTLDQVWLFAGMAFVALRPLLTPIPPHDFWWHMATGRLIAATGQIPATDSFSFTQAGQPFYNQSWLGQLLMYGLYQLGGAPLLVLLQALMLAGAYGLLLRLCLIRTDRPRLSVAVLLGLTMPASFDNWIVRPQTYALPLFIAYLYILTMWRLGRGGFKQLLILPALAVIWVNLHGSFVLGGALIGLTFVGVWLQRFVEDLREQRAWASRPIGQPTDVLSRPEKPARPQLRQVFLAGLLTGAAWLINPGGLQVIGYVRNLLGSSAVTQLVTEWASPSIRDTGGLIFFLFVIVGIVILTYAPRRPDPVDMLIAGAFLWLALGAVRNNIWFTAVATPLLVTQLDGWFPADRSRPAFQGMPGINATLAGIIVLMLLLSLPWVKPVLGLPPSLGNVLSPDTPVAAVEHLAADTNRPQHLFHAMSYGSYMIWELPAQKVFADPRIELYPLDQWLDYQRLSAGYDVEGLLAKYQIDGLLLSNEQQAGLLEWAKAHPAEWEQRYADEESTYFVKR